MWKKAIVLWAAAMCLCFSTAALADWTDWLNRDTPTGKGDYETLSDFLATGAVPCTEPDHIECRTVDGVDWKQAGQKYKCSLTRGGICVNAKQPAGEQCLNYEVRFLCDYEPLRLSAESDTAFECGRFSGIRTEVVIDIAGGVEPYACYGPAGADIQISGNQCVAVGLTPKKHSFVVADFWQSETIVVDVHDVIEVTKSVACGTATGSATVSVSGLNAGLGPFTYRWNTDPEQTGPTATGLANGTYSVIVADAAGCFRVFEVVVGC